MPWRKRFESSAVQPLSKWFSHDEIGAPRSCPCCASFNPFLQISDVLLAPPSPQAPQDGVHGRTLVSRLANDWLLPYQIAENYFKQLFCYCIGVVIMTTYKISQMYVKSWNFTLLSYQTKGFVMWIVAELRRLPTWTTSPLRTTLQSALVTTFGAILIRFFLAILAAEAKSTDGRCWRFLFDPF